MTTHLGTSLILDGQIRPEDLSFEGIRRTVELCPQEQRYDMQVRVMEYLIKLRDENTEAVSLWYSYVLDSGIWKERRDNSSFQEEWERARKIHEKHRQNLDYIESISHKAALKWGEGNALVLFTRINTRSLAEQVSKLLSTGISFDQLKRAVNRELVERLDRRGRGNRRSKNLIQGDFARAAAAPSTGKMRPEEFKKHGLKLDQDGFLTALAENETPTPDLETEIESEEESGGEDVEDVENVEDMEDIGNMEDKDVEDMGNMDDVENREDKDVEDMEDIEDKDVEDEDVEDEDVEDEEMEDEHTDESDQSQWSQAARIPDRSRNPKANNPDILSSVRCSCLLPRALLLGFAHVKEKHSTRVKLALLRRVTRSLGRFSAEKICYRHTRLLCWYLGLYIRGFKKHELLARLDYVSTQIGDWDGLVKEKDTWFRPGCLPGKVMRSSFRLQPYDYHPRVSGFDQAGLSLEEICLRIYGEPVVDFRQKAVEFDTAGNVVLPQLFGWLEDDISEEDLARELSQILGTEIKSLLQLVHLEFDMYDYHYTPAVSRPRLGWNRSMFQSLTQQLVRQDISYYAVYVAARPDHAWRLISFPYYTKSVYPGEDTKFLHVDMNIDDYLATGRGGNALQGSVTFTDEDEENCTVVLPKMHRREILQQWWDKVSTSPEKAVSGQVIAIQPWMWNPDYAHELGTDFESSVCRTGDVRLTMPTLPHGSTGPATIQRRTVMPWFGVVHEDHDCLETAETERWRDIADAHREMRLAERIPSGSVYRKFVVHPYSFPGTAQLTGLGAISDALLGRIKWSEWSVTVELDILFGPDRDAASCWIQQWRRKAHIRFLEAFQTVISAEMAAYRDQSFFCMLKKGQPIPEPDLFYQKDLGENDPGGYKEAEATGEVDEDNSGPVL